MSKQRLINTPSAEENPLFHDTWKLLKNYRDAVWNLELVVQQVRNTFEIEYGSSIEEFLDSIYLAGADIGGSKLENYAKSIEGYRIAICGYQRQFVAMNKNEVTCKKCLKKINSSNE